MTVRLLVGDVRERIREIPDGSIDLLATSPPFLALRKYGENSAEMGSERTPADFLDALLELTQEFRRVLAPHGSIAIELGDTYSGSGGAGGDYESKNGIAGMRAGQPKFVGSMKHARTHDPSIGPPIPRVSGTSNHMPTKGAGWPLAKSLTLIPTLYPASLAYGWNMLNPAHTFDRWRVRNVIVWARPNPPVGALGDKVRPATSYITVACTSAKRWFDLDAVRHENPRDGETSNSYRMVSGKPTYVTDGGAQNPVGAPPLDWWEDDDPTGHATLVLPTQPYPGAHYATWPEKLAARLIEMMCPLRVCTTCGEPSRRIAETTNSVGHAVGRTAWTRDSATTALHHSGPITMDANHPSVPNRAERRTLGWSDCGHGPHNMRPGRVLDPFAGSGTTLAVAQGLGRDAIGIELYEANAHLCRDRIGMFLSVDEGAA